MTDIPGFIENPPGSGLYEPGIYPPAGGTGWHTVESARFERKFSITDEVLAERLAIARNQCLGVLASAGRDTTGGVLPDWRLAQLLQTAKLVNLVSSKPEDSTAEREFPMDWHVKKLLVGFARSGRAVL